MIPNQDKAILEALARYYALTRAQIQSLCMPRTDDKGRTARRRLNKLLQLGLINQTRGEVVFTDRNGSPAPVYYPSKKACEYLYVESGDERYLSVCTLTPNWQYLNHWVQVSELHIRLDRAIALQQDVTVERWISEWDIAAGNEQAPEKRFKLFTLIRENPRLVFAPDAGFMLSYQGYRRGYYLELDRGTSGIAQIANSKTPGAAAMAAQKLHARHFPEAAEVEFRVLLVSPTASRRDALRKSIASKPGNELWRFVAWPDVTPEKLLYESIIYGCAGDAMPLVKRAEGAKK